MDDNSLDEYKVKMVRYSASADPNVQDFATFNTEGIRRIYDNSPKYTERTNNKAF